MVCLLFCLHGNVGPYSFIQSAELMLVYINECRMSASMAGLQVTSMLLCWVPLSRNHQCLTLQWILLYYIAEWQNVEISMVLKLEIEIFLGEFYILRKTIDLYVWNHRAQGRHITYEHKSKYYPTKLTMISVPFHYAAPTKNKLALYSVPTTFKMLTKSSLLNFLCCIFIVILK